MEASGKYSRLLNGKIAREGCGKEKGGRRREEKEKPLNISPISRYYFFFFFLLLSWLERSNGRSSSMSGGSFWKQLGYERNGTPKK